MKNLLVILHLTMFFSFSVFSQTYDKIELTKKEERKIKRYIHPQSKYISVSAGFGFTSTHIKDPNNFLSEGLIMQNNTYFPNVMYEHGIRDGFFAEAGYSYIGQGISLKRDYSENSSWGYYRKHYSNHDIQLGIGYRLANSNNFNFFNLHAGMFFGVSNMKSNDVKNFKEGTATISVSENVENTANLNYQLVETTNSFSRLSVGPYLGLSKDIRLSSKVRIFVKYVHRFGLNANIDNSIKIVSDNMTFDDKVSVKVRGGGAFISGGLKISVFSNKLPSYEIQ